MSRKRVVVAMSGGVDSSLAAARLQQAGYEVIGVTMQIWPAERDNVCCGVSAIESAKQVAYKLGIPHYLVDFRDTFARQVIADFCEEYSRGWTPNPCVRCNHYVKFGALLEKARELDADYLATGHYARVEPTVDGYRLLKAVDPTKDQSYFLYTLGQYELQRLLLPLGNLLKTEVRRMAAELGLPSARRHASQDICFIPDNDYRSFVARYIPAKAGDIIDTEGKVLGQHQGIAQYTVGQRQGLGVAARKRLYVLKLLADSNRVIVGTRDQLFTSTLTATRLTWVSGKAPETPITVTAKIRYKSPPVTAEVHFDDDTATVKFHQPQRAVTPGQSIVFYDGEVVFGGGIIADTAYAVNTVIH